MNFTREPIIETVISARDGYRLIVRSTKQGSDEEFTVDAVEIVSFGNALFYRNLEHAKPFLLPISDYQIVEGKESRVVLKNAQFERIKIGGGREASLKKEEESDEPILPMILEEEVTEEETPDTTLEHKRQSRRNRRRRSHELRQHQRKQPQEPSEQPSEPKQEAQPLFTHLIPPPPNLISASIHKYKEQQSPSPEPAEVPQKEGEGDANSISRSITPPPITTDFSSLTDWNNF